MNLHFWTTFIFFLRQLYIILYIFNIKRKEVFLFTIRERHSQSQSQSPDWRNNKIGSSWHLRKNSTLDAGINGVHQLTNTTTTVCSVQCALPIILDFKIGSENVRLTFVKKRKIKKKTKKAPQILNLKPMVFVCLPQIPRCLVECNG